MLQCDFGAKGAVLKYNLDVICNLLHADRHQAPTDVVTPGKQVRQILKKGGLQNSTAHFCHPTKKLAAGLARLPGWPICAIFVWLRRIPVHTSAHSTSRLHVNAGDDHHQIF